MPLTFIDIERQKSWRIGIFFLVLLALYLVIAALFVTAFFPIPWHGALQFWLIVGLAALFIAGIHFWFSAYDTVRTVIQGLEGQPPDPQDDVHTMFLNIIQEIQVVTGSKRKIQCTVIPSFSLNALAVADLRGEAAIGITEGLLSRLTRPQLEAVIAHEAHHILSGDCLEATVAASLFGTYVSAIEKMSATSQGRAFASPTLLLAWLLMKLSQLLNMFISREREYRADAAAVRMTRNPIALAETLYMLSRSWRGAGFIGSGYEMLCIVNPRSAFMDETEGFWADLLSTHPPLRKRMDILLSMAHANIAELDARSAGAADHKPTKVELRYYAMNPQQKWQGPFTPAELGELLWLSPLTWVTQGKNHPVDRASKEPSLNAIFMAKLASQERPLSDFSCPACSQQLVISSYEGTQIYQCRFCSGILVDMMKIPRIIARTSRERLCSERIVSLAKAVASANQMKVTLQKHAAGGHKAVALLPCPKCGNPMFRCFYSQAHLIEIDRCSFCSLTWFEQDELEMLQCMIEHRLMPDVTGQEQITLPTAEAWI